MISNNGRGDFFLFYGYVTYIFAANGYGHQDISILEPGKMLNEPDFFSGRIIRVDGNIEGTTFVSSEDVMIYGIANGNLFKGTNRSIPTEKLQVTLAKS